MPHKKFPLFKNNTKGNNADSVEANYKFVPNDRRIVIHCERTCSFYVFDTCDEMVAFLVAQKKANPELLNYHEVIRGQSYQKLRFNIDTPIEFIENAMADIKKPELEAKPAKPEATGLNFIDSLEFGIYGEKLAEVRHYNDYVTKTSLNEMRCALLMNHIKVAIGVAFSRLYFSKGVPVSPEFVEENLLVFDSSDKTKFSRHIIIPGVHVQNHMEAKAFADEMVKYLDEKLRPVVDLGILLGQLSLNLRGVGCWLAQDRRELQAALGDMTDERVTEGLESAQLVNLNPGRWAWLSKSQCRLSCP